MRGEPDVDHESGPVSLRAVWQADVRARGNDVSGHEKASEAMVSSDSAFDESEVWCERTGIAANSGAG